MKIIYFLPLLFLACSSPEEVTEQSPNELKVEIGEPHQMPISQKMAADLCNCMQGVVHEVPPKVAQAFIEMSELPKGTDYKHHLTTLDSTLQIQINIMAINFGTSEHGAIECSIKMDEKYAGQEYPSDEELQAKMRNVYGCELAAAFMKVGIALFE